LRSSEDLLPLLCAYYYFLIKGVKNNEWDYN
jgi:hypothetical protein